MSTLTSDERWCICSDPENCTQRVPGYRCKKDFMPKATLPSKDEVPHWDDVAAALRDLAPIMPEGMRPLAIQAATEIEQLRGLKPELPPRPPDGEGLPRFGLRHNGPGETLATPMADGYWTPWHLAERALIFERGAPETPAALIDKSQKHCPTCICMNWEGMSVCDKCGGAIPGPKTKANVDALIDTLLGNEATPSKANEQANTPRFSPAIEAEGMAWWNNCTEPERAQWLKKANSAAPADAWQAFRMAPQRYWMCSCKPPGNINIESVWVCKDCGTPRPNAENGLSAQPENDNG